MALVPTGIDGLFIAEPQFRPEGFALLKEQIVGGSQKYHTRHVSAYVPPEVLKDPEAMFIHELSYLIYTVTTYPDTKLRKKIQYSYMANMIRYFHNLRPHSHLTFMAFFKKMMCSHLESRCHTIRTLFGDNLELCSIGVTTDQLVRRMKRFRRCLESFVESSDELMGMVKGSDLTLAKRINMYDRHLLAFAIKTAAALEDPSLDDHLSVHIRAMPIRHFPSYLGYIADGYPQLTYASGTRMPGLDRANEIWEMPLMGNTGVLDRMMEAGKDKVGMLSSYWKTASSYFSKTLRLQWGKRGGAGDEMFQNLIAAEEGAVGQEEVPRATSHSALRGKIMANGEQYGIDLADLSHRRADSALTSTYADQEAYEPVNEVGVAVDLGECEDLEEWEDA